MAQKLSKGDTVFVPRERLQLPPENSAFFQTKVVKVVRRSVEVSLNGGDSRTIASSLVHADVGVLMIRCGDFSTESSLLDPLAKSLLQYFRLLLNDDMVRLVSLRSCSELKTVWQKEQAAYSHLVLIGHGKEDAIKFGVDDWIRADSLADILTGGNQKTFISLCCKTGNAAFAKKFSVQSNCGAFIAPFHGIHGAVASQFCQTFYSYNMLKGNTIPIAFKKARDAVVQGTSFRLWKNGNMLAGQK